MIVDIPVVTNTARTPEKIIANGVSTKSTSAPYAYITIIVASTALAAVTIVKNVNNRFNVLNFI